MQAAEAAKREGNTEGIAVMNGQVVKELRGLEYGGEVIAKCNSCDAELFTVMKVSDAPARVIMMDKSRAEVKFQRFQSNCPFCNAASWIVKAEGTLMVREAVGKTVLDGFDMGDPLDEKGMMTKITLVRETNHDG